MKIIKMFPTFYLFHYNIFSSCHRPTVAGRFCTKRSPSLDARRQAVNRHQNRREEKPYHDTHTDHEDGLYDIDKVVHNIVCFARINVRNPREHVLRFSGGFADSGHLLPAGHRLLAQTICAKILAAPVAFGLNGVKVAAAGEAADSKGPVHSGQAAPGGR